MASGKPSNTLSLSFSRNRLAYAVFCRRRLDFYAGKTLRQYRSARVRNPAFASILRRLITSHQIEKIALPAMNRQQGRSAQLRGLYRTVIRLCLKERVTCSILDPVNIRQRITGSLKPTKFNAINRLVEHLPELKRYARNVSDWERKYYGHIFTAIGCGFASVDNDVVDDQMKDPHG